MHQLAEYSRAKNIIIFSRLPYEKVFSTKSVATLVALFLLAESTSALSNGRIIGGKSVSIESYPYQVSLEHFENHACGGAIISSRHVVTAGHCVNLPEKFMRIRSGTSFKREGGSLHEIFRVIRHERYEISDEDVPSNDLAIVELSHPMIFDEKRRPVRLFASGEKSRAGGTSVVTGWGETRVASKRKQLQAVSLPIVDRRECDEVYERFGGLAEGQICAGYRGIGGSDACSGDSGGPLTIDGRLAGVVSWGIGCALPEYPGIYTEIAYYRRWIRNNTGI